MTRANVLSDLIGSDLPFRVSRYGSLINYTRVPTVLPSVMHFTGRLHRYELEYLYFVTKIFGQFYRPPDKEFRLDRYYTFTMCSVHYEPACRHAARTISFLTRYEKSAYSL